MRKHLTLLFAAATLLTACDKNDAPTPADNGNFFTSYLDIESMSLRDDESLQGFVLEFSGKEINARNEPERFRELAEKNRDTEFSGAARPMQTFAQRIAFIEITANREYDSAHPAGSSLRDVFGICADSYRTFIESGYRTSESDGELLVLRKLVSDTEDTDYRCWSTAPLAPYLYMAKPFTQLGTTYQFTVSVTLDDGRTFIRTTPQSNAGCGH
ncbi:MAG: hypothetical protein K2H69_02960 [Alistipes sp.]|nr:hypothetical protein [Alistipes sp.]